MILFHAYHSVASVVATASCITASVSPSLYLHECNNGYNIEFCSEHSLAENNIAQQSLSGQAHRRVNVYILYPLNIVHEL
jgi:hypothetical protein